MNARTALQFKLAPILTLLGALLVAAPALGQDFPSHSLKIITPFATGGASDVVARIVAEKMASSLGQPVVVENRVGAGGAIAMEAVARAEPDGYTIGFTSSSALVVVPLTKPTLTYPRELKPVSHLCNVPIIMVTRATLPVTKVSDLVQLAKKSPGKLNYGSSGIGGLPHVMGENFNNIAGVRLFHVPYKGDSQEITALLSGDLDTAFLATASVTSLIESGKLRGLAIAGTERAPDLPEIPTFAEAGYPESSVDTFYGLVIASATPQPIVDRIAKAATDAVRTPEVRERMRKINVIPVGTGPAEFAEVIRKNTAAWSRVIGLLDLKELAQ